MAWKLSPALVRLRDELNAAYPARSTLSDGSIGDTAHSARKSDHNPDGAGWVRAIDVTEWDPGTPNVDGDDVAEALAEFLRAKKDPRVKYVIWRGRMFASYATASRRPWTWGPYSGPNGHFKHCHVSVVADARGLDAKPWGFSVGATAAPPQGSGIPHDVLRQGAKGDKVTAIQYTLNFLGHRCAVDGMWGPNTTAAVKAFQAACKSLGSKVTVDGVWGPQTAALAEWWTVATLAGKR